MTEIERIMSKGILPQNFLKQEIRCNFLVDESRKKLWAIELDLLLEFDQICKKHNLKYFLMAGSLLGAIRHDGFIPWDDDIDVGMFRDDYEKLLELSKEFKYPYFLQTPYTDEGCYFSFAKLRNSNTTAISHAFRYEKFNQGICLDIFPFDNCKLFDAQKRYDRIKELVLDNSTYMRKSLKNPNEEDKKRLESHSGRNPLAVYEEIQQIACQYNQTETEHIALFVCTICSCERLIYKKEAFQTFTLKSFENIQFPIPIGYDHYLRTAFGNYMEYPPVEKRNSGHNSVIYDTEKSYTEFIE